MIKKVGNLSRQAKAVMFLIVLQILISLLVFKNFIFGSHLYVYTDVGSDTLNSYWPIYNFVREAMKNLNFSSWSFNLGMGNNVFSLNMFLFDPFNIFLIFAQKATLPYMLLFVSILKIILSGLFFFLFLRKLKLSNFTSLLGALLYSFNGYTILWGQHYFFATTMVYLPLMLYSIELYLQTSKGVMLSVVTALVSCFGFYFLYSTSILVAVYVLYRTYLIYGDDIGKWIKVIFKIVLVYVAGIAASGVLLFPQLYVMLNNPRISGSSSSVPILSLNTAKYYFTAVTRFFSNDMLGPGNSFIGVGNYYEAPILYGGLINLLLIPQLFKFSDKRGKKALTVVLVSLTAFLILPYFSYAFNGFSYVRYRWTFIIVVLEILLGAYSIEQIFVNRQFSKRLLTATFLALAVIIVTITALLKIYLKVDNHTLHRTGIVIAIVSFLILAYFIVLFSIDYKKGHFGAQIVILIIVVGEMCLFSYISVNHRELLDKSFSSNREGYFDYSNEAVNYIKSIDKGFYRIDKDYLSEDFNDNLLQGFLGVKSYNSLNSPGQLKFMQEFNIPYYANFPTKANVTGTNLETICNVKYLLSHNKDLNIYGYELIKEFKDVYVYRNNNFLPFGFTYNSFITKDEFEKVPAEQKGSIVLNSVVLENSSAEANLKHNGEALGSTGSLTKIDLSSLEVSFSNIKVLQGSIASTLSYEAVNGDPNIMLALKNSLQNGIKVSITVDSPADTIGEIFWASTNQGFNPYNSTQFEMKKGKYTYEKYINASDIRNLRLDIGSIPGKFNVENLELLSVSPSGNDEKISKLREETLKIDSFKDTDILGKINVSGNKLLYFSIPYDKGWSAYVDGKKTNIYISNTGFSGIFLNAGEHEIELKYSTPGQFMGTMVSVFSIVIIVVLAFRRKKV